MKNVVSVAEGVSVCEKPCTITLSASEMNLLSSVGIQVHGPVRSYPQLFLKDCGKFVTTDSKRTLRDNSCVQYTKEGFSVGILYKVIQAGETLAIVKKLEIVGEKLCTDTTTYAKIEDHYLKVCLARYICGILY